MIIILNIFKSYAQTKIRKIFEKLVKILQKIHSTKTNIQIGIRNLRKLF